MIEKAVVNFDKFLGISLKISNFKLLYMERLLVDFLNILNKLLSLSLSQSLSHK